MKLLVQAEAEAAGTQAQAVPLAVAVAAVLWRAVPTMPNPFPHH